MPETALAGLAVGATGRIYVAAAGTNQLVVLGGDGAEIEQISSDAFAGPVGLAFRGESLLVISASGTIARAAVEDEAGF